MIDASIDRLERAYRDAKLPRIRRAPRRTGATLDEIAREIHPLRLPAQVEAFWRRVDPSSIAVVPQHYPSPARPGEALASWRQFRDEPVFHSIVPRLLFPVCAMSDCLVCVELDDGNGGDGALVRWCVDDGGMRVDFPHLASYLDLLATMVELREFERRRDNGTDWIRLDPENRWDETVSVRLAAAQPLPRLGRSREFRRQAEWPQHWLGPGARRSPDRHGGGGATTTAANLLGRAAAGAEATGTIRARVESALTSGSGVRVTVDDGSTPLDVWCPLDVCPDGPVLGRTFDFDVVVRPRAAVRADADRATLEGLARAIETGDWDVAALTREAVESAARAGNTPATAEATAIRPVS